MENKNSKSDSFVIREAENIIENYLKKRELRDIRNYYELKKRYDRLKVLTIALLLTSCVGSLLSLIL